MIEILAAAPQELQLLKRHIMDVTGLGKDVLHTYAGLAVFLIVRLLWRWHGGWVLAWFAAFAGALVVEWLDMQALLEMSAVQPDAVHWHDVWNTMFWPTVLLLTGRWLHPQAKKHQSPAATSSDFADQPLEQPSAI